MPDLNDSEIMKRIQNERQKEEQRIAYQRKATKIVGIMEGGEPENNESPIGKSPSGVAGIDDEPEDANKQA